MMNNQKKLLLIICLFCGIPLLFGCFIDVKRILEIAADNQEQLPIRMLRVTITPSKQEKLFDQLQKFADKHDFNMEISDYGTGGSSYVVWIMRDDIRIAAMHNPYDRDIVKIGFYDETRATPVAEKTIDDIDELIIDLKDFISEIPDVTITEKWR